ncbi:MAG: toxin HicA [Oscillospiraceae bacterium]|nr:toxin HicA [Oscillospiraceae bacterium]MCL2053831.1 toxin HicA [Oscillospiraceae bacterium]
MSQWDKLISDIIKINKNLRFEDLAKALKRIGYTQCQPKSGSSHYTFRKIGKKSITIPKQQPMNKVYILLVKDALLEYEKEDKSYD